jgi:hypothetical protein
VFESVYNLYKTDTSNSISIMFMRNIESFKIRGTNIKNSEEKLFGFKVHYQDLK